MKLVKKIDIILKGSGENVGFVVAKPDSIGTANIEEVFTDWTKDRNRNIIISASNMSISFLGEDVAAMKLIYEEEA